MNFIYKTFLISVLFFILFISKNNIFAAKGPEEIKELEEKVYYNITPEKPNIGDTITLEAEMYGTPVKDALFVWKIDGEKILEEIGKNRFTFVLNKKTKIDLSITTGAGVNINKTFDFDPKKIIIIWESKTFTPPFYKGKSLYSPESSVILNAINIDQENPLTNTYNNYKWSVNGTIMGDKSGVGYSSFLFQSDLINLEPKINVSVSGITSFKDKNQNKNNSYNNETSIIVNTSPSEIISYEKTPLLGILLNKAIKNEFILNKNETSIVSYPLNYSFLTSLSGIYSWYLNDTKLNTNLNQISFKKVSGGETSRLTVKIKNIKSILQSRQRSYFVNTPK